MSRLDVFSKDCHDAFTVGKRARPFFIVCHVSLLVISCISYVCSTLFMGKRARFVVVNCVLFHVMLLLLLLLFVFITFLVWWGQAGQVCFVNFVLVHVTYVMLLV